MCSSFVVCRFTLVGPTPICFSAWLARSVVTQCQHWSNTVAPSLLRRKSRAAVLPPSSGCLVILALHTTMESVRSLLLEGCSFREVTRHPCQASEIWLPVLVLYWQSVKCNSRSRPTGRWLVVCSLLH